MSKIGALLGEEEDMKAVVHTHIWLCKGGVICPRETAFLCVRLPPLALHTLADFLVALEKEHNTWES
ncbi:hypothetical protein J6590_056095 [Homalodisca vitripennis]|nr:hypothetical protein J6590_056095 [Homalodisca vitripennis]